MKQKPNVMLARITPQLNLTILFLILAMALPTPQAHAGPSTRSLIDGFNKTVFGSEFSSAGSTSDYVRKFNGTVRFYIDDRAAKKRSPKVRKFIQRLNSLIPGVKSRIVTSKARANFVVYVVDRKDYRSVVQKSIYRNGKALVRGRCFVRSVFSRSGIKRSDAIIVSDEGERLFNRCLVEEILQGLGPLNEHPSLNKSMFNDRTKFTRLTKFDRYILAMLYHRRVRNGAKRKEIAPQLSSIVSELRKRLR